MGEADSDRISGMRIDLAPVRDRLEVLQVRKQWVIDTLRSHDQIEVVTDSSDNRYLVVLKKVELSTNYWGLLVRAGELKDGTTLRVDDVLKVPWEIIPDSGSVCSPVETLAAMAERYGAPVMVGNLNQKFLLSTKMKVGDRGVPGIRVPQGFQGYAMVTVTVFESDGERYLDFVFGYAIDMRAYLPAVGLRWPFA